MHETQRITQLSRKNKEEYRDKSKIIKISTTFYENLFDPKVVRQKEIFGGFEEKMFGGFRRDK